MKEIKLKLYLTFLQIRPLMKTFAAIVLAAVLVALPTQSDAVVLGRGHLDYGYQIEETELAEAYSPSDEDDHPPQRGHLVQKDDADCDCDDEGSDSDGDADGEENGDSDDGDESASDDEESDSDDEGETTDLSDLSQVKNLINGNMAKIATPQTATRSQPARQNTLLAGSARIP